MKERGEEHEDSGIKAVGLFGKKTEENKEIWEKQETESGGW